MILVIFLFVVFVLCVIVFLYFDGKLKEIEKEIQEYEE